ncbi:MAG: hypothetical protein GXY85_12615 [Candidatus Brocadiaceae bacterium]|nr:hypothetical protein [Candidatus Brocadiaceae bacterium]
MTVFWLRLSVGSVLGALFVLCAFYNARLALSPLWRPRSESYIVLLGGIAGMVSLAIAPFDCLRAWWWLPLLVDIGCLPFLACAGLEFGVLRPLRRRAMRHRSDEQRED